MASRSCPRIHWLSDRSGAKLAVALYPEQVHERDESNDLPLHIAVQSRSSSSLWDASEDDAHAVADIESLVEGVDVITGQRRRGTPYTPCTAPVIKTLSLARILMLPPVLMDRAAYP